MPDSSRRMVLTVLVEAFGVADARHYVERQLVPYFVACGVRVEGLSGDGLQRPRLDDPRGSPANRVLSSLPSSQTLQM